MNLKGRCFCNGVQFEIEPPTQFVAHCHCESCRLSHSAPFVTWTAVNKDKFHLKEGEALLKWYASSDFIEWGFCSQCGSSMLYRAVKEGHPDGHNLDRIYISAGSITNELDQEPGAHVSFEEKISWYHPELKLPKYKGKGESLIEE